MFNDQVGNTAALTSLKIDADVAAGAGVGNTIFNKASTTVAPSVQTSGLQDYNDAVTLGADTVLASTTAGNVTFERTVNGAFALEANTTANEVFNDLVGNTAALTSLKTDVDAGNRGGQAIFNVVGTTVVPSVKTTGVQTYFDNVLLGANSVFTSTGPAGDITYNGRIDGAANNAQSLAVNAGGGAAFVGAVGLGADGLPATFDDRAPTTMTVTAGKAITQVAAFSVVGLGDYTSTGAGAAGNITLANANNNFGSLRLITLMGAQVTVAEASATSLDDVSIGGPAVAANFNLTSGGDIAQANATRTLQVGGASSFTAPGGSSILLDNTAAAPSVNLNFGLNPAGTGTTPFNQTPLNSFAGSVSFNASGPGKLVDVKISDLSGFEIQPLSLAGTLRVVSGGDVKLSGGPLKVAHLNLVSTSQGGGIPIVILDPDSEIANSFTDYINPTPGNKLGLATRYLIYDSSSGSIYSETGILKVGELLQRILAQTLPRFVLQVKMPEFTSLEVGEIKKLRGVLTRSSQVFATGGLVTRSGQVGQGDKEKK